MIIDLILDRKNGATYNAEDFYRDIIGYENIFELSHDISVSLDFGTNTDVQQALCRYIDDHNYNPDLKQYICSVNWIIDTSEHNYNDLEHCKKCVKCAAIAHQEINNINLEKHIEEKTKEVFTDSFMQGIQDNLRTAINSIFSDYFTV